MLFFFSTKLISAQKYIINQILECEKTDFSHSMLISNSTASGNEFIRFEKSAKIFWKAEIKDPGWYDLVFRYRSPEGEKVETLTRNEYVRSIGFGYAKEWNNFTTSTFLQSGINEISLLEDWGTIDLDYLKISPANVSPTIKRFQIIFTNLIPVI